MAIFQKYSLYRRLSEQREVAMKIDTRFAGSLRGARSLAYVLLLCGLIFKSGVAVSSTAPAPGPVPMGLQTAQVFDESLKDQWGIELTALHMTAAGHMVDFRYRVLDADKAAPLFQRQTKPYLIHEESGKVLAVPNTAKVGSLRNSNMPQQGRIYWMFFGNNGVVKNGDKVSVVIGDFRADNLIVE